VCANSVVSPDTLVTYAFTATLTDVPWQGQSELRIGDEVSGEYTFNTVWTDSRPEPEIATYTFSNAPSSFALHAELGSLHFVSGTNPVRASIISVDDGFVLSPTTVQDAYVVQATPRNLGQWPLATFDLELQTRVNANAVKTTALTSTPLSLPDFETTNVYLDSGDLTVRATLTSLTRVR
jgi:hypothetical protein